MVIAFDFGALTESLLGATVTCTRHAGQPDDEPETMCDGATGIAGTLVLQRIVGGVAGTDYAFRCQVDTPQGDRLVLAGVLPVRAA